jgi:hypothetical protein
MQYNLTLVAGQKSIQQTSGTYFLLMNIGLATGVEVVFYSGGQVLEHVYDGLKGLKAVMTGKQRFDRIEFTSATAATIKFIISDGAVDMGLVDGATVNVGNSTAIPVSNDRGSPGNPVYINGTVSGNPAAVTIVDNAAVNATAANGNVVAANANRVSIRVTNTGANPVAIGSSTLTWAKAAVIINPGDTWVEERGANLAWYCICNTGLATTLGVQEITA